MKNCELCGKEGYITLNKLRVCVDHYLEKEPKECLRSDLYVHMAEVEQGKKLPSDVIVFLKKVKEKYPDMVEDFPLLFRDI